MKMKGLLTFSDGILCKQDVLGRTYVGQIAGIDVAISFPRVPDTTGKRDFELIGMSNPLLPPKNGENFKRGEEKIVWGHPMCYPSFSSCVNCVLFEINCQEHEDNVIAQRLYNAIGAWEYAFTSFCQLSSKQDLHRDENIQRTISNLELLSTNGYIQNTHPQTIYAHFYSEDSFISNKQLEQAIAYATSGKELLLEYQMLLSAYKARNKLQNRQAIVDACSAVEICLVNRIKGFCADKGIDPEILLSKYRSLGERFKLAEKLDSNFATANYRDIIVNPRNDIAHNRDVYPTNKTTDDLISAVEQCLEHYHISYY